MYAPQSSGGFDSEHFDIRSPGGNVVRVHCTGTPTGPDVCLSVASINFGEHDMNRAPSLIRTLTVYNRSAAPALVFFRVPSGAFSIQPKALQVKAASEAQVTVTFQPSFPINYYMRVPVIVKDSLPLVASTPSFLYLSLSPSSLSIVLFLLLPTHLLTFFAMHSTSISWELLTMKYHALLHSISNTSMLISHATLLVLARLRSLYCRDNLSIDVFTYISLLQLSPEELDQYRSPDFQPDSEEAAVLGEPVRGASSCFSFFFISASLLTFFFSQLISSRHRQKV